MDNVHRRLCWISLVNGKMRCASIASFFPLEKAYGFGKRVRRRFVVSEQDRTMLAKHSLRGLAALTAQRHAEGIGRCYGPQLALSRVILQPSGALTLDPSQGYEKWAVA